MEKITGVLPEQFKLEDEDTEELETMINSWIIGATSAINEYINHEFKKDEVPPVVKLVCTLMTSNIVAFGQSRRETPIIKKNDWSTGLLEADIFTDELKAMLDPFKVIEEEESYIDVFAITGEPDDYVQNRSNHSQRHGKFRRKSKRHR